MTQRTGLLLVAWGALCVPFEAAAAERWVQYPSSDGFELHAQLLGPPTAASAVLLLHQCDRKVEGPNRLLPLGRELAAGGLHVLLPDLRGYGLSVSGPGSGRGPGHLEDARAAIAFLAEDERTRGQALAVLGASCSGRTLAGLVGGEIELSAVVLLSAALGPHHLESLAGFDGPMLCIAADGDPFGSSFSSTREACRSSSHPRTESMLERGEEHGAPLLDARPELFREVARWLVQTLRGGETGG